MVCFGRENVTKAVELLDKSREPGFLACIDADWSRLEDAPPPSPNLIYIDHHDLTVMLLNSSALGRVLAERASIEKLAAFEAERGGAILNVLLAEAVKIGSLRWLNSQQNLSLRFEDLTMVG